MEKLSPLARHHLQQEAGLPVVRAGAHLFPGIAGAPDTPSWISWGGVGWG